MKRLTTSITIGPTISALALAILLLEVASGEMITWTGGGPDMNWRTAANWDRDPPREPGTDDDVKIPLVPDKVIVQLNSAPNPEEIHSLMTDAGTQLDIANGIELRITGDGVMRGTIDGTVNITSGGVLAIGAGMFTINGPTEIENAPGLGEGLLAQAGADVTVNGSTTLTGASLGAGHGAFRQDDAILRLPNATTLNHLTGQRYQVVANGRRSLLDLLGVTLMEGPAIVLAKNGGTINLSSLVEVSGPVTFESENSLDPDSAINLSSLHDFAGTESERSELRALSGGVIRLPDTGITTLTHVDACVGCELGDPGTIVVGTLVFDDETYLFGRGTIVGNLVNQSRGRDESDLRHSAGVVPLNNGGPQTIAVNGNYTQDESGELGIVIDSPNIGPPRPKRNSSLDISRFATLGGELTVNIAGNYLDPGVAKKGDSFTILTAAGEVCEDNDHPMCPFGGSRFDSVEYHYPPNAPRLLKWTIAYRALEVDGQRIDTVTLMVVPEPSTAVVTLLGVLVVGWRPRRHQRGEDLDVHAVLSAHNNPLGLGCRTTSAGGTKTQPLMCRH